MQLEPSALVADIAATAARAGKTRLVIAFSGGLDSSVLLHVLATAKGLPVRAVHIDHGLQGPSDAWLQHVRSACSTFDVGLEICRLALTPPAGESVEAHAREARYQALAESLQHDELLLLAQHRDDQAETLMLQLLRGAGPAGLASMPRIAALGETTLMRPLLSLPQSALRDYANENAIAWYDDPSNADLRYDRNYLRARVMPSIRERWPGADKTLARAARLQSDAMRILQQQAAADLRRISAGGSRLHIARLRQLTAERRANLLRFALVAAQLPTPPASRLESVLALCETDSGRGEVRWPGASVRRYRDLLYLSLPLPPEPPDGIELAASDGGRIKLPGGLGTLELSSRGALDVAALKCRFRRGGERVREASGRPSTSLAQWFQQQGVPPWQRSRMPMLFHNEALVAIGDLTLHGFEPGAKDLRVVWRRGERPSDSA